MLTGALGFPYIVKAHPALRARVVNRPAVAGGGPDLYYYAGTGKTEASFELATDSGFEPQNFAYGSQIAVAVGGTCTLIGVKSNGSGATLAFKIALYDASNNLLASGNGTAPATMGWTDVAISQTVTATNYRVMVSALTASLDIAYDSGQNGLGMEVAHAAFPPNPLVPTTETGLLYGVRMFVD